MLGLSYILVMDKNIMIIAYIINVPIPKIFFVLLMPLIIYNGYKTFYVSTYIEYHDFNDYKYNKFYNIIFSIFLI